MSSDWNCGELTRVEVWPINVIGPLVTIVVCGVVVSFMFFPPLHKQNRSISTKKLMNTPRANHMLKILSSDGFLFYSSRSVALIFDRFLLYSYFYYFCLNITSYNRSFFRSVWVFLTRPVFWYWFVTSAWEQSYLSHLLIGISVLELIMKK